MKFYFDKAYVINYEEIIKCSSVSAMDLLDCKIKFVPNLHGNCA
jgi:hypothetical protein